MTGIYLYVPPHSVFFYLVCWFVLYSPDFFLFLFFLSSFHKSTVFVRFVCHPFFFWRIFIFFLRLAVFYRWKVHRVLGFSTRRVSPGRQQELMYNMRVYTLYELLFIVLALLLLCVCGMSPCSPRPYCRASLFFFHRQTF